MSGPDRSDAAGALAGAAALLDDRPGTAHPRTVVRLLRRALELALDHYWNAARPGEIPATSGRGRRLRLLAATLGRTFAHDTYRLWTRLSDAARPAPYDPAPTTAELRELQRRTKVAVGQLLVGAVTNGPAIDASSTSRT